MHSNQHNALIFSYLYNLSIIQIHLIALNINAPRLPMGLPPDKPTVTTFLFSPEAGESDSVFVDKMEFTDTKHNIQINAGNTGHCRVLLFTLPIRWLIGRCRCQASQESIILHTTSPEKHQNSKYGFCIAFTSLKSQEIVVKPWEVGTSVLRNSSKMY